MVTRRQILSVEVEICPPQKPVRGGGPHQTRQGDIANQEPAFPVLDVDEVWRVVYQRAQQIALGRQRFLRSIPLGLHPLALGDVSSGPLETHWLSNFIKDHSAVYLTINLLTVFVVQRGFKRHTGVSYHILQLMGYDVRHLCHVFGRTMLR